MIGIGSNANIVITMQLTKLAGFDAMRVCNAQAANTVQLMRKRIHQEGKASDDSKIGTYSEGYMKVRTGNYGNSRKRDSGVYTRGAKKGAPRTKYNRTSDTTVVLSLTRQQEQDLTVIPIPGGYGVGYTNPLNMQKALWADETYGKKIFSLTSEERAAARQIAENAIEEYMR